MLLGPAGNLLAEAGNTVVVDGDCTAHAEMNAIRAASRGHGRGAARGGTLYASAEPCPMCAGAIHWAGIGRLVHGADIAALGGLGGAAASSAAMPDMGCRAVFAAMRSGVDVLGPLLEAESLALFGPGLEPDRREP